MTPFRAGGKRAGAPAPDPLLIHSVWENRRALAHSACTMACFAYQSIAPASRVSACTTRKLILLPVQLAASLDHDRAARSDRTRCPDRDSVLRHLPLRPAPGPQRVERVYAHCLSLRSGPRDRRPRDEGRLRQSPSSSPATSPRWAAWWIRTAPAPSAWRAWSSSARTATFTYNLPDKHLGGVTYGGYSDSIVVDQRFVLRVPDESRSRRSCASALRRNHDLLADAPLGREKGQESRRGRPWRTGPHGA